MQPVRQHKPSHAAGSPDSSVQDVMAVLLVGGLGTRLRSVVPSAPKPLAAVGNASFLSLLVRQLRCQGIRRLILCTGYLAEQIEREFGDGKALDVEIQYSAESQPLGTAGALRLAQPCLDGEKDFLVLNGDSFFEIDFRQMLESHRRRGGIGTMAVRRVPNASRYGTVRVDDARRVIGFAEKTGSEAPGLINAGVYVFRSEVFAHLPEGPASLERDVFPKILDCGLFAVERDGMFIDIGTPEDYARAQQLFERLYEASANPRS